MQPLPLSQLRTAAGLVFLSGQVALQDGRPAAGGVAEQTDLVIDRIEALLAEHRCTLADVVKATVWLVRQSDFAAFNQVYASRFATPYPARSTVVSQLAVDGLLVEIEVVATLPVTA